MISNVFLESFSNYLGKDGISDENLLSKICKPVFDRILLLNYEHTRLSIESGQISSEIYIPINPIEIKDFKVILGPSSSAGSQLSTINFTLRYNLPFVSLLSVLHPTKSNFSLAQLLDFTLTRLNIRVDEFVQRFLVMLHGNSSETLEIWFDNFIQVYNQTNNLPNGTTSNLNEFIKEIYLNPIKLTEFSSFVLNNSNLNVNEISQLINDTIDDSKSKLELNNIWKIFKPRFDLTINDIGLAIVLPSAVLQEIDENSGNVVFDPASNLPKPVELSVQLGSLVVSTEEGILFDGANQGISTPLCLIPSIKLGIKINKFKPLINFANNDIEFKGIEIESATLDLSRLIGSGSYSNCKLSLNSATIDSNGFSGNLVLEKTNINSDSLITVAKDNFQFTFNNFNVQFQQNEIIDTNITGSLKIPGFKKETSPGVFEDVWVNINGFIGNNGDLSIAASVDGGLDVLTLPDVFKISVAKLAYEKKDGKQYIKIDGKVTFLAEMEGVELDGMPKEMEIKNLKIYDDGKIEFEKPKLGLPKVVKLAVGPVKLTISELEFGAHEQKHAESDGTIHLRKYKFFGFNGALNTGPGGVAVKGDGIKYYYTIDNNSDTNNGPIKTKHHFLRIEGIGIDIKIPADADEETAQFLLNGYLSMKNAPKPSTSNSELANPNPGREYLGNVSFKANKLKFGGNAAMRINPDVPAYLVDVNIDIPTGIPIGAGMSITGFRGLVGQRYLPNKEEAEEWWQYYKKPTLGINFEKFKQKKGFSLGAGVSLETTPDKGRSLKGKVFFLLGLPDVFLLSGQMGILSDNPGAKNLNDPNDPPFKALVAITKNDIKATLGVDYPIPDSGETQGEIADIHGEANLAFFFKNAGGWYVNVGKDLPETARVKARIIKILDAYAFLMLSKQGIKVGAGAKYGIDKSFLKVVKLKLGAYLDLRGNVAFKPLQLGGSITLGGYANIQVLLFKLGLNVEAYLAAEAPKPLMVCGRLSIAIALPKPMKSKKVDLEFSWILEQNKIMDELAVINFSNSETIPAKAKNMITEEVFNISSYQSNQSSIPTPDSNSWSKQLIDSVIPMDSFIDISLDQSVENKTNSGPDGQIKVFGNIDGVDTMLMVPPVKGLSEQVKHELEINQVKLFYWDESTTSWLPYSPYESPGTLQNIPEIAGKLQQDSQFLKKLPLAYWQAVTPNKNTEIRILGRNMFSYLSKSTPGLQKTEYLGYTDSIITCAQNGRKSIYLNFEDRDNNEVFVGDKTIPYKGSLLQIKGVSAEVKTQTNSFNKTKGLFINTSDGIEITLQDASVIVKPKLSGPNDVIISYYKKEISGVGINNLPNYVFTKVLSDKVLSSDLDTYSGYNNPLIPVEKISIEIIPGPPASINNSDLYTGINYWMDYSNNNILTPKGTDNFTFDEFCMFEKALTDSEISNWKNNGSVPSSPLIQLDYSNSLNDSSGNGFNAQLIGNGPVKYVKNRNNNANSAMYFNYSAWPSIPHNNRLSLDYGNYSIGFWFKLPPFPSNRTEANFNIISKFGYHSGNINSYPDNMIQLAIWGYKDAYGKISLEPYFYYTKDDGTNTESVSINAFLNPLAYDTNWHLLNIVYNRQKLTCDLFVDGTKISSDAIYSSQSVIQNFSVTETYLHEIEYLDEFAYSYNVKIPSQNIINQENQQMSDALTKTIQPVWRPHTKYAIQIEAKDKVNGTGNMQYFNFGFSTDGPTGHFNLTQPNYLSLKAENREDEFALATLKPYINFARSTPSPDGNTALSKPLFWKTPKITLYYNTPYAYMMFDNWQQLGSLPEVKSKLKLTVKDPLDELNNANLLEGTWVQRNNQTIKTEDEKLLERLAQRGPNCSGLPSSLTKVNFVREYQLPDLMPNKLYTALYDSVIQIGTNSEKSEQIHKHGFITSRYENFEKQIKSFHLSEGNNVIKAIYPINLEVETPTLSTISNIISGNSSSELVKEFADIYDRILNGALELKQLSPADTTEVRILKNNSNSSILGFIVRNPEPFVDPRVIIEDISQGYKPIQLTNHLESSGSDTNYIYFYSKDKTSVFITNTTLSIPDGTVDITFRNLEFDGNSYVPKDANQTISFVLNNQI